MRMVARAGAMQRLALAWRSAGTPVAFVPTMGYLHAGHMSLVGRARRWAGPQGRVVVSLFVNPTQFGPREDLASYPRDLVRDRELCAKAGVDILFAPSAEEMYVPGCPEGHSTYVTEERLSQGLEGASRPTHFRGVATVVAKLFNLVLPGLAVFGAKDFQQAAVVCRMVRDLNFPVRVDVAPTCREPDGLAMSSRNSYLSADERRQAVALWGAIREARRRVRRAGSRGLPAGGLRTALIRALERQPSARVDYVTFVDARTLEPLARVQRGARMVLAVFIGRTRLIDNARI